MEKIHEMTRYIDYKVRDLILRLLMIILLGYLYLTLITEVSIGIELIILGIFIVVIVPFEITRVLKIIYVVNQCRKSLKNQCMILKFRPAIFRFYNQKALYDIIISSLITVTYSSCMVIVFKVPLIIVLILLSLIIPQIASFAFWSYFHRSLKNLPEPPSITIECAIRFIGDFFKDHPYFIKKELLALALKKDILRNAILYLSKHTLTRFSYKRFLDDTAFVLEIIDEIKAVDIIRMVGSFLVALANNNKKKIILCVRKISKALEYISIPDKYIRESLSYQLLKRLKNSEFWFDILMTLLSNLEKIITIGSMTILLLLRFGSYILLILIVIAFAILNYKIMDIIVVKKLFPTVVVDYLLFYVFRSYYNQIKSNQLSSNLMKSYSNKVVILF